MSTLQVFVGLDYHQDSIQVCVLDSEGRQLVNGTRGNHWEEVASVVPAGVGVSAAIEACSGAADFAEELMAHTSWKVELAHPGYVARIKQSPDKTDFSDARLLADLQRVRYLPKVWLAPDWLRELRRLVRYRQQLANERRNTKLRIRALLRDQRIKGPRDIQPWTKKWFHWLETTNERNNISRWILHQHINKLASLEKELKAAEQFLQKETAEDPVVQELLKQPGIGLVTAVTLRAEIGRFNRFQTGKQLARFCSVTPRNASSGNRQADAGLIKAGNPELRRVLIETANRLKWQNEYWTDFSNRMKQRGKAPSVITAAIANRFVRRLYHQMMSVAA